MQSRLAQWLHSWVRRTIAMKHNEAIPRNHLSELIQRLWLHRLRFLLLSRNSFSAWRGGRQHLQGKGMWFIVARSRIWPIMAEQISKKTAKTQHLDLHFPAERNKLMKSSVIITIAANDKVQNSIPVCSFHLGAIYIDQCSNHSPWRNHPHLHSMTGPFRPAAWKCTLTSALGGIIGEPHHCGCLASSIDRQPPWYKSQVYVVYFCDMLGV